MEAKILWMCEGHSAALGRRVDTLPAPSRQADEETAALLLRPQPDREGGDVTDPSPHSELPPVSREALEANLRSTHANLDFCIQERQRLEEQLESTREALLVCRRYLLEDANGDTTEDDYYEALNATEIASNPATRS